MKRKTMNVLAPILLAVALVAMATVTVSADAPTTENWGLGYLKDGTGAVTIGYYINTVNLQVDSFWIDNQSGSNRKLTVVQRGEVIFVMYSPANSGYAEQNINNFKFQRLPATDPDDPNSVRYPPNTSMFIEYY